MGAVALFGVVMVTFLLEFVVPGDPARSLAPRAESVAELNNIRHRLHLDQPIQVQLWRYLSGLSRGDLGESFVQGEPVRKLVLQRLPATAMLAVAGVLMELLLGGSLGILAALSPRAGRVVTALNLLLLSLPVFTIGLLLLLYLGFTLNLFPVTGGGGLPQLVLPALTLGLAGMPYYAQILHEQMAEALSSTYVRTALSKGLSDWKIVLRHAFPNTLPALATLVGLDLGAFLSGVIVVETVFGWPGIGSLAVQSLQTQDRPIILGTVLVGAAAVIVFNIAADFARMFLDPRTR